MLKCKLALIKPPTALENGGKRFPGTKYLVIKMHPFNTVINCIPCLPLPGQKRGLTRRFTEYCVTADPEPTLCLCREIFPSKGLEIYYAGMSTYAGTLTKGTQGYGAGTYPGITRKCPLQPWVLAPWASQSTKLNFRASPR